MICKCCDQLFEPLPNIPYDFLCEDCTGAAYEDEYETPCYFNQTDEEVIINHLNLLRGSYGC